MIKTSPEPKIDRREHTPPVGIRWHEYADLFPWMDDKAFADLKADIAANGVIEPIVFIGDAVLDGRNRYMAARELGVEYPRIEFTGDDPLAFVLAKNLARRHLTDRQRADVAAKIAKLPAHRPAAGTVSIETVTIAQAAKVMDVPVAAVKRAKEIAEHAEPELKKAYEAGTVSQSAAAEVAKLPAAEQKKAVAEGKTKQVAKEQREARKADRAVKQAENDKARDAAAAALPPAVKAANEAKAQAIATRKAAPAPTVEQLQAEIEELREANTALEAENAALKADNAKWDGMRVQFENGGFEEVIAVKDKLIATLETRVARESDEKVRNLNSMEWWKKQALKLGYSTDEIIDLSEGANA